MSRAFLGLSVLLLVLVAATLWWAQSGQQQSPAVEIIKQLTIALLLLLILGFIMWLMKSLLDNAKFIHQPEALTMKVTEGREDKLDSPPHWERPIATGEEPLAEMDTQAQLEQIKAMIADDPEKVAQIVNRWIAASE